MGPLSYRLYYRAHYGGQFIKPPFTCGDANYTYLAYIELKSVAIRDWVGHTMDQAIRGSSLPTK